MLSLEERERGDQGAQRHEQHVEGRGGTGVAQVAVAARHDALIRSRFLGQVARFLARITARLVGAAARNRLRAVLFSIHLHALVKSTRTVLLFPIAVAAGASVALERPC